ncbi:HupE/UreJ family protein [Dactylosporangium salmoneum]|uniref:HupE/UreJ family protein n=1 Tax=Dactylosporangium salmoneum TaxID=53361 RepID=A0ABP5S9E9_9ACTN
MLFRWLVVLGAVAILLVPQPAGAHGFSSTVYVTVGHGEQGHVRTALELEYDLLVVSAADAHGDDQLFRDGDAAFRDGDAAGQAAALAAHADAALHYVTERFQVTAGGQACTPSRAGDFTIGRQEGVPYAGLSLDWACPPASEHEIRAGLFADAEGYVKGVKTIVTYDLDGHSGSAALDAGHAAFSTGQAWYQRFWEFFRLGAEHLLTGIDHILFLLALIAGSRRLREIVLAATSFTLAHSVTFMLAALGAVDAPAHLVEPVIALSIAVVAVWHLLKPAQDLPEKGLDRAGWIRLAVVFCFGLVHGLGFAGALGIDEPWSWTLLWSLLVFNVGIEVVQLGIIAAAFPLLMLLRRHAPKAGRWTTGGVAAGVAAMGLIWFFQRAL